MKLWGGGLLNPEVTPSSGGGVGHAIEAVLVLVINLWVMYLRALVVVMVSGLVAGEGEMLCCCFCVCVCGRGGGVGRVC